MKLRYLLISTCAVLSLVSASPLDAACGRGQGNGVGQKIQNRGKGKQVNRSGTCRNSSSLSTLSEDEVSTLKFMFEEEKFAGDVYAQVDFLPFTRISRAERKHQSALKNQLLLHKVDISELESAPAGVYINSDLQALYNDFISRIRASRIDALKTGAAIEEHDIASLNAAIAQTAAPELKRVYGNLLTASRRHLASFVQNLSLLGINYSTSDLSDADLNGDVFLKGKGRRMMRRSNRSNAGTCPNP